MSMTFLYNRPNAMIKLEMIRCRYLNVFAVHGCFLNAKCAIVTKRHTMTIATIVTFCLFFHDRIILNEIFSSKVYVFRQCLLTICFDIILIQF